MALAVDSRPVASRARGLCNTKRPHRERTEAVPHRRRRRSTSTENGLVRRQYVHQAQVPNCGRDRRRRLAARRQCDPGRRLHPEDWARGRGRAAHVHLRRSHEVVRGAVLRRPRQGGALPGRATWQLRQNVEQVQLGTLEMSITTGGGISNVFGPIQAFDIPYLYRDDRVIRKFMQDPELTASLRKDVLEATGTVLLLGMSGDHGWRTSSPASRSRRQPTSTA